MRGVPEEPKLSLHKMSGDQYLIWGYYGTCYRVRLLPHGGIVLYTRNILVLGSTAKNNATQVEIRAATEATSMQELPKVGPRVG